MALIFSAVATCKDSGLTWPAFLTIHRQQNIFSMALRPIHTVALFLPASGFQLSLPFGRSRNCKPVTFLDACSMIQYSVSFPGYITFRTKWPEYVQKANSFFVTFFYLYDVDVTRLCCEQKSINCASRLKSKVCTRFPDNGYRKKTEKGYRKKPSKRT